MDPAGAQSSSRGESHMKALIVDDDVFVRKCIGTLIPWESLGFERILEASNGAAALELALNEKPDVVISDVKMPILNGLEFAKKLREATLDTYIIILSEYSDFEYAREAMNYGVQDYILKPFTKERIAEITDKIRQIVARDEKRRFYNALMADRSHMRALIRDMLDKSDSRRCMELFDSIAGKHINTDDVKRFCLLFIDEMFEQVAVITFRKAELTSLRAQSFARHDALKTAGEIRAFTEELCEKCMELSGAHIKPGESYIQLILDYIDKNYSDPDLSIAKIAEQLHLSPVYVGALFKQHQGVGILPHIHEVRICAAIELIKDLSLSITDISARIGYITPDYFTRIFKKSTGLTPSEYRSMILVSG